MLEAKEILKNTGDETFGELHKKDVVNGIYNVYSSASRCIDFKIYNKKLLLACEDYGEECRSISGKDEYEFYYSLDEENTHRFLTRLRIVYGCEKPIGELLKEVFGCDDGTVKFANFCEEQNIITEFYAL